ncbi:divergent polysaccharide deacetylase family protein [Skermanella rosea]|uniref:divergent polysaccharide deacetylase family protein n=1 Tax=Skermanella rosea TaxID=1817965 RepID=UPI0019324E8E|nr:divergent polysaccharide deacetylase family protein [Skermanella rosea]UEM02602.1 divergent polysaccharide deacetylase family protein [Skermanella rosea]
MATAAKQAPKAKAPKVKVAIDVAAIRRAVAQAFAKLKPRRRKAAGPVVDGERTLSTEIDTGVERNLVTRRIRTVALAAKATARSRNGRRAAGALAVLLPVLLVGGTAAWLVGGAEETERELAAAVPRIVVPVLAPDSGGVIQAEPAKAAPAAVNSPYDPVPMVPAPAAGLIEDSPRGPLPRIASDGRTPWQTYARPFFHDDKRPRIALVIGPLGISSGATLRAIEGLPGAVTLAFASGAGQLGTWVDQARRLGHEVMLDLPAEPADFPRNDPGPGALLVSLDGDRNQQRLLGSLGRVSGYVGVLSLSGNRFTGAPDSVRPMLAEVNRRGLMFLDARAGARSIAAREATRIGLPRAIADTLVDEVPSGPAIEARLRLLEEAARLDGAAVGIAQPYPVTLDRLSDWIKTLEGKGIVLAPITALVNKQADR